MSALPKNISGHHARARGHRGAAALVAVALSLGITACADSEGPEEGVTAGDLQDLEDRLNDLEDRVEGIEDDDVTPPPEGVDDVDVEVWTDPEGLLGDEVTVSAEVTEVLGANDTDIAFRIAEPGYDAIAVIASNGPSTLREGDVVQVTGRVTVLEESTFENDFGIAADGVLQDADAFFDDAEGQVALDASSLEVIEGGS